MDDKLKLTIHYVSDVHTEFDNSPKLPLVDVIILAGDIGSYQCKTKLLDYLKYVYNRATHIIWVLGNHEFYGSAIDKCFDKFTNLLSENNLDDKIHLLDLDILTLPFGSRWVTFFGCTLWTNITNHSVIQYNMNDYVKIRGTNYGRLYTHYINSLHKTTVKWLDSALTESRADIKIIISHHMPHLKPNSIADPFDDGYRTDLSWIMEKHKPALWIYGHTHEASDVTIHNTRCLSNPVGYPGESTGYLSDAIVEII
jgi:predicted phosphodiesterase